MPEPQSVHSEIVRRIAARERLSAATSWVGFGLQALIARGYTANRNLLIWLGLMVLLELLNGQIARSLRRHDSDPVKAARDLRFLVFGLFLAGSCWGGSSWLPGLRAHELQFVANYCVLVVVGVFSIHNLSLDWRALAAFSAGLIWPMLVQNVAAGDVVSDVACVVGVVAFVMIQVYGTSSRNIERRQIEQKFEVAELAASLQQKNAELGQALSRISTLASQDPLTDCLNRRALTERFAQQHGRRSEDTQGLGVIMIDADHFKKINDGFGHDAGDQVLVALAECIRSVLRTSDLLGRWGGEEFVCVVSHVDEAALLELAERLRSAIASSPVHTAAGALNITVSLGVALVGADDGFASAIRRADQALYRAKAAGRNRVCV